MKGIRLIVGLGNPGAEYTRTRHNAGFWLVDALATAQGERWSVQSRLHAGLCRVQVGGAPVCLLKPCTWINKTGTAVGSALHYYKVASEQCLLVHDDLDLPPGSVRLKFDGGHGGHNGLRDTLAHVGHGRFHRMRIGIGHPGERNRVIDWVLSPPKGNDAVLIEAAIVRALDVLPLIVTNQFDQARQTLHAS